MPTSRKDKTNAQDRVVAPKATKIKQTEALQHEDAESVAVRRIKVKRGRAPTDKQADLKDSDTPTVDAGRKQRRASSEVTSGGAIPVLPPGVLTELLGIVDPAPAEVPAEFDDIQRDLEKTYKELEPLWTRADLDAHNLAHGGQPSTDEEWHNFAVSRKLHIKPLTTVTPTNPSGEEILLVNTDRANITFGKLKQELKDQATAELKYEQEYPSLTKNHGKPGTKDELPTTLELWTCMIVVVGLIVVFGYGLAFRPDTTVLILISFLCGGMTFGVIAGSVRGLYGRR